MYFSNFFNLIKNNLRFRENVNYHSFNFISKIFVQILFPPLMIFIWGAENYGIWIMIISLGALFIGINFNLTEVVRLEMTKAYKASKKIVLNELISNLFFSHTINICLYILIALIFYNVISIDEIRKLTSLSIYDIRYIFTFIFFSFLLENIINYFYPVITFKGYTKIWVHQNTLFLFYSRILILTGFVFNDFKYLSLIYFISNLVRFLIMLFFFIKEKENLKITLQDFSIIKTYDIFKKSISYSFEKINASINQNFIILLIGNFFSPSVVALITTARTMFSNLPSNVYDVIFSPALIEFVSIKNLNPEKIIKKLLILLKPILFTSLLFIIFSFFFGEMIYGYWITDSQLEITKLFIFLLTLESFLTTILTGLKIPFKSNNNFLFISRIETFASIFLLILALIILPTSNHWIILFMISNSLLLIISILFIFNYKNYLFKLNDE